MAEKSVNLINPTIPLNSIILVTGVNGLIGSHVADQILAAGYQVRGVVRNRTKNSWLEPLFASKYGNNRFELAEVSDFTQKGIWDKPIKGVSGVVSVAGLADLTIQDVEGAVKGDLDGFSNLLSTANAEPTVKAFVFTSTSWAAWMPKANTPIQVTEATYNEEAVNMANDASLETIEKGIAPFMAAKVKVEQECWDWVARENPPFTFNVVLPDMVIGPILNSEEQSASTAGMVKWLVTKERLEVLEHIPPQWFIDARDLGKLYVAVLNSEDTDRQRLFGCGARFSYQRVLEILKESYPLRKSDFANLQDAGWDETKVPNEKALDLLNRVGQSEWTSLEQSAKDNFDSFTF